MSKVISIVVELLFFATGLYFYITIAGKMAGYYSIGEGYGWVHLFFFALLLLNSIFYILIRVGIETKQKLLFFVPGALYFLLLLIGPGIWFSSFSEGFTALGIIGLLFIAFPILILLTLRYLFLKVLARGNKK